VSCSAALTIVATLGIWGLSSPTISSASTTPTCATSDLVVWLNTTASGAAGSDYYHVNFTNIPSHSCALEGYPGVLGISFPNTPLGSAVAHDAVHPARLFTLASARSATGLAASNSHNSVTAILQLTDVGNYSATKCPPVTAVGLRVNPPGQTATSLIPYPFVACSKTGSHYLHVEAIQKYVATQ